jgi:hypothetical protein
VTLKISDIVQYPSKHTLQKSITLRSIHEDSMADLFTVKVYLPIGHLHPKNLSKSEIQSSSHLEKHLTKIFGKLPPHMKP